MYCQEVSVSGLSGLIIEHWIVCMLAYFDDSGNKGNSSNPHLTLACVAAHRDDWTPFESAWREKLKKHNFPYFHAKEILTGTPDDSTTEILRDFTSVIHDHAVNFDAGSLIASSCTLNYDGYGKAKAQSPLIRHEDLIVFDRCLEIVLPLAWTDHKTPLLIKTIFDAKDHCFLKVEEVWEAADNIGHPFAQRFARPQVESSKNVCGLQAADLIAWFLNRHYSEGTEDAWGASMARVLMSARLNHIYLDEE